MVREIHNKDGWRKINAVKKIICSHDINVATICNIMLVGNRLCNKSI